MKPQLYIFDLDHTLISTDSNSIWNQFLVDRGLITDQEKFLQQEQENMVLYAQGKMQANDYIQKTIQPISHLSTTQIDQMAWQCIHQRILPYVYPDARHLINRLQQQRQPILIISATVSFLVEKIAQQLAIPHALGINLKTHNGCYLPEISGIPSYQAGKVTRLQQWLAEHPRLNGEIHFYTDSINDLPLCQYADHTWLVNPCPLLQTHNHQAGWPVLQWKH